MKLSGIHYAFVMATGLVMGGIGAADYVMGKKPAVANTNQKPVQVAAVAAPKETTEEIDHHLAADCVAHLTFAEAQSQTTDSKVIEKRTAVTQFFMTALATPESDPADKRSPNELIVSQMDALMGKFKSDDADFTQGLETRLTNCYAIYDQYARR